MSAGTDAPIIVTATFGAEDAGWLNRQRAAYFPPARNHLDAHLTLFHHLSPSLAGELAQALTTETKGVPTPRAVITQVMNLGRGTAYRVASDELDGVRHRLRDRFAAMLVPQDAGGWRPHVTVQNKVTPAEAKALQAELGATFQPRPLAIRGLAAWWYRGGPWELIREHRFG